MDAAEWFGVVEDDEEEDKQWTAVIKSEYAEYFKMAKEMIDNYEEE